jgi:hypothetical protein
LKKINFSLHGIATKKQTRKNAFDEEISPMVNHTENSLSLSLFSSLLFSCVVFIFSPQQMQNVKVCGAPNPNPNHLLGGQEEGAVGG